MDNFYELSYMESSIQLLKLQEEIRGLKKEKEQLEQQIELKEKKETELSEKNLHWLKIVNEKMGVDKYSPQKRGLQHPSPKKVVMTPIVCTMYSPVKPTTSSSYSKPVKLTLLSYLETPKMAKLETGKGIEPIKPTSSYSEPPVKMAKLETEGDKGISVLSKYKSSSECEMPDEIDDDELLSADQALSYLENDDGKVKKGPIRPKILENGNENIELDGKSDSLEKESLKFEGNAEPLEGKNGKIDGDTNFPEKEIGEIQESNTISLENENGKIEGNSLDIGEIEVNAKCLKKNTGTLEVNSNSLENGNGKIEANALQKETGKIDRKGHCLQKENGNLNGKGNCFGNQNTLFEFFQKTK